MTKSMPEGHVGLRGLYAISDPALLPGNALLPGVEAALQGGANIIQYRNKTATHIERLRQAADLVALVADYQRLLIINDDIELCLRVKACGVHLGKSDGDLITARNKLGSHAIIGVTCHSDLDYASQCHAQGASYCAFGRLFPSRTKPSAPECSLKVLEQALKESYTSVAIGGISADNARQIIHMGCPMVAAIHGVFGQQDIQAAAQSYSALFL